MPLEKDGVFIEALRVILASAPLACTVGSLLGPTI